MSPGIGDGPRYVLVIWCNDCKLGRHDPMVCTTVGLENRIGRFRDADAARWWVENSAVHKRPPFVFELEDLESGERVRLTGFRDSDWDSRSRAVTNAVR